MFTNTFLFIFWYDIIHVYLMFFLQNINFVKGDGPFSQGKYSDMEIFDRLFIGATLKGLF